jgi:hypothetical protein
MKMVEIAERSGPRGAPPKKHVLAAYRELLTSLYYATQIFHEKGDTGREGIIIACHAVAQFIAVRHENPELAAPFLALRAAMLDLQKGRGNPILMTEASDTPRPRSQLKKHMIVTAAACLEALVELNDPLEIAASRVARQASKWPGIGTKITANTIKNWRDSQRSSAVDERKSFELISKDLLTRLNPREAVEKLLQDGPPGIPKS